MSNDKSAAIKEFFKPLMRSNLFYLSGIFTFLFFYTLYLIADIILPFIFALLLSFLLAPLVKFLRRWYIPAHLASALVILLFLAGIGYGAYSFTKPATIWINKGPQAINEVNNKLASIAHLMSLPLKALSKINELVNLFSEEVRTGTKKPMPITIKTPSNLLSVVATSTWKFLAEFTITVILLYFLLIYDDFFLRKIVHWTVGLDKKIEVVLITREVQEKVFKYLFAKTAINFGLAIAVSLLMFILGMPNPILWGVIAGILEFIPYFGALVSLIIITIVAIFSFASINYAFLVAFLFLLLVFIEGNFLTPIILGNTLMLNPIIVFLSLLFWNWLWGIAGVFIAIPMMVTIKIVFDALYEDSLISELLSD